MTKPPRVYNYKHPTYIAARAESFSRSGGICQSCGRRAATEAHHWALTYPPAEDTTANDLTALCKSCHWLITSARRYERHGGSVWGILPAFEGALESCDIKSPSMESRPSSFITARPDSTPEAPPSWRSPASSKKRGSNRTETEDLRIVELECQNSLYIGDDGKPTIPASALRAALEAAARKTKQGPDVREGLLVESIKFIYDVKTLRKNGRGDREVGSVHRPGRGAACADSTDAGEVRLPVVYRSDHRRGR